MISECGPARMCSIQYSKALCHSIFLSAPEISGHPSPNRCEARVRSYTTAATMVMMKMSKLSTVKIMLHPGIGSPAGVFSRRMHSARGNAQVTMILHDARARMPCVCTTLPPSQW